MLVKSGLCKNYSPISGLEPQVLVLKPGIGKLTFAKSTFNQHVLHSFTART